MKKFMALFFALLMTVKAQQFVGNGRRVSRESIATYGGVINGKRFGGTYYTPDNGPTVKVANFGDDFDSQGSNHNPNLRNRYGEESSGGHGNLPGSGFAGAAFGGFSSSGSNFGQPPSYFPFQGPQDQPFNSPSEFYNFLQNFFSIYNDNLSDIFHKNIELQRNAFNAATKAFSDVSRKTFGAAPNINFGADSHGAYSSASIGPGSGHASARIHPENQRSPNVNTRFASDTNNPRSFGISTSASSSSSNINGKKNGHKEASATINENGKVTTYSVQD